MVNERDLRRRVNRKVNDLLKDAGIVLDKKHTPGIYYPVDSGRCMRRTFFKYKLNVSNELKERAKGRILMSSLLERMYLSILEDMGYSTHVKLSRIVDGIEIRGEADAMNDEEIIELKTVTPTAINKIPFKSDIVQLNIYLWMASRPKGYLLYIKSDNPSIYHLIPVIYTKEVVDTYIDKIKKLHEHIMTNKIPPKIEDTSVCRNCVFRQICEKIDQLY